MNPFMSHTARERLNDVYRIIRPKWVFCRSNWRYMIRIGTTTASGGRNRVDRIKKSQSLAPGILNRLNP